MECIIATNQAHFYDQILVRKEVFIKEQFVPIDEEYDELDKFATQFIVYDGEQAVGAARVRILTDYGKIERVCVLKSHRKRGVGKRLMEAMENYLVHTKGITKARLSAQVSAIPFYEKLGYTAYGPYYLDANIEHRMMEKDLK